MSAGRYDRRYLAKVTVNVGRFQESRLEPSRPIAQTFDSDLRSTVHLVPVTTVMSRTAL